MLDSLVFVREARTPAERAAFYRAVDTGGMVLVVRGVAAPAEEWRGWSAVERYRARIQAIAATTAQRPVFSHAAAAAAALWRTPWLGSFPKLVDARFPERTGRSTTLMRAHGDLDHDDVVTIDGLAVTTLARTVVDVAVSAPLETAVIVADSVLAARRADDSRRPELVELGDLHGECARVARYHGATKARAAIDFADPMSGSPGESLSRVGLWRIGAPTPILQQSFPAPAGRRWIVDFWWPDVDLVGEFDGLGKYLREPAPGSIADAIIAEKRREDGLRALGPSVARWGWDVARSRPRLRDLLESAGLPLKPRAGSSASRANVAARG